MTEQPPAGMHPQSKRHINPDGSAGGWVEPDARVSGNAEVYGDAWVYGNARVYGNAQVYGDARVSGTARVSDHARVSGTAQVSDPRDVITAFAGSEPSFWTAYRTVDGWALNAGCEHFPDLFNGPAIRHEADPDDTTAEAIADERRVTLAYLRKMARIRTPPNNESDMT